ncbi:MULTISPECIES: FecCD family ABC transporter permease [unclassified Luteococcus]|uniref:FecCD family ABC transporter permease n=1 Tax=unclassified Luteococcus TaxID=2639923 RepID=UPI00313CD55C
MIDLLACLGSLAIGSQWIEPTRVWAALSGRGTANEQAIVMGLRLPRTLLGMLCGASMGMAGALTQAHTRNPLADPGLLGVGSGASFAVVCAMVWPGWQAPSQYVWAGVAGAVIAGIGVIGLGLRQRSVEPMLGVVLIGAVVTALLGSATSAVVITHPHQMGSFQAWSTGSLDGRGLDVARGVLPVLLCGLLLAVSALGALPALELGDRLAASLGSRAVRDRAIGLAAVVLLCGGSTAACGSLGFIGLLAPHAARRLCGGRPVMTALLCLPTGIAAILIADIIGRVATRGAEVPVGVTLAALGAPLFVSLARRAGDER